MKTKKKKYVKTRTKPVSENECPVMGPHSKNTHKIEFIGEDKKTYLRTVCEDHIGMYEQASGFKILDQLVANC